MRVSGRVGVKSFILSTLLLLLSCSVCYAGNIVQNPSFGAGNQGWVVTSNVGSPVIFNYAGSGHNNSNWYAALGRSDSAAESLSQDLTIPSTSTVANLSFYYQITTAEAPSSTAYDKFSVDLLDPATGLIIANVAKLSNLDAKTGWIYSNVNDISVLRGKTVRLRFSVVNDSGLPSSFQIDDVMLNVSPVKVVQVDTGACPAVNTSVAFLDASGTGAASALTAADFSVLEDGVEQMPFLVNKNNNATATGDNIVMLLDYSGSLTQSAGAVANMESAAINFIDQMGAKDTAEVIKFSTAITVVNGFTSDKTALTGAVTASWSGAGNGTSLYDALYIAITDASKAQGNRAIVAITDGYDESQTTKTLNDIITYAVARGVQVYTIGLGNDMRPEILTQLATNTGGQYYYSATSADLQAIYQKISDFIRNQYVVTYRTSRMDSAQHTVTVRSLRSGLVGSDSRQFTGCGSGSQGTVLLGSDNGTTAGMVSSPGVVVKYRFTATVSGEYRIYTTGTLDTVGVLYNADGVHLADDDDSGTFPNFSLRAVLEAGQIYMVGVTAPQTGSYNLVLERPGQALYATGSLSLTPIYPQDDGQSSIMQGGKAKRVYQLMNAATQGVLSGVKIRYRSCIQGAPLVCGAAKEAQSDPGGFLLVETDWIEDQPGSVAKRTIRLVDAAGNILADGPAPSYSVLVYPRSLLQEEALLFGAEVGAGVDLGVGADGLASASFGSIGATAGLELGASIVFNTNEYAVPYGKKNLSYLERTVLGLNASFEPSLAGKLEGPNVQFTGSKLGFASAELKVAERVERHDLFPDFFSNSTNQAEIDKANVQRIGFAARLYELATITQPLDSGSFFLSMLVSKLYEATGLKGFYDGTAYETIGSAKVSLGPKLDLGGKIVTNGVARPVPGIHLSFDGALMLAVGEEDGSDASYKKSVRLSYDLSFSAGMSLGLPVGKRLEVLPSIGGNVQIMGGTYSNQLAFGSDGQVESIKLGMTTDRKAAGATLLVASDSVVFEKKLQFETTSAGQARLLYQNGVGVRALAGVGLINGTLGLLDSDLQTDILDYLRVAAQSPDNYSPPCYYHELSTTKRVDVSLPLKIKDGLELEVGLKLSALDTTTQIEARGVSLAQGNFETEEYRLNDGFIRAKNRDVADIGEIYLAPIRQTLEATLKTAQDLIDKGKVSLDNAIDSGMALGKKAGDLYNWVNYTVHLGSTFTAASTQKVVALRTLGLSTVAGGTAATIGQTYFVNLKDPSGTDLATFPAPLTLSIKYALADLTAAGLSAADAGKLSIYRWSTQLGHWSHVGGAVDPAAQTVSVDITGRGTFILAFDTSAPVIGSLAASDSSTTPTISALVTDSLSGIDTSSLLLLLNDKQVVNGSNWKNYFNPVTGSLAYRPATPLAPGNYTASLSVKDTSGNSAAAEVSFVVHASTIAISHSVPGAAPAGTALSLQATASSGSGLKAVWVAYRLGMDGAFKLAPMTATGSVYAATIPAADTNGKVLSYYFAATDLDGYSSFAPMSAPQVPYLLQLQQGSARTLMVNFSGAGEGSVVATPPLSCSQGVCTGSFAPGSSITLEARPAPLSEFGGWSPVCSGLAPCTLVLNSDQNLTASFVKTGMYRLNAAITGTGGGTVAGTPGSLSCASRSCNGLFSPGAPVTLTALQDANSRFTGWSGAGCSGLGNCQVTMDAVKEVSANFTATVSFRQLLVNADFEAGKVPWEVSTCTNCNVITNSGSGHGGSAWSAWLGGQNSLTESLSQTVSVPATALSAKLGFAYRITTEETNGTIQYDKLTLQVVDPATGAVLKTLGVLSNLDATSGWGASPLYDLSAYKGQTIRVNFLSSTDSGLVSTFQVDDVLVTVEETVPMTARLTLLFAGTGSGSVNSDPAGIACTSGSCGFDFSLGETVKLWQTSGAGSDFGGWTGDCIGGGPCTVTMNQARSATASFVNSEPVRIEGSTPSYFHGLQAAYDAAPDGAVIMVREGELPELLVAARPISVTIKGGFDQEFKTMSGESTVSGKVLLRLGKVKLQRVNLK